ncbi:MAG: transporter substrate-binding domain-containing protein [Parachlamydiaceae bacterium]
MSKTYLLIATVLAIVVLFNARAYHREADEMPDQALIMGTQSGYPPFEFIDSTGTMVGFDVDLASLIAKKLNRPLVIEDMEFEGLILSLKQRKIDLTLSGMSITPSRLKEIAMIPYHGDNETTFSLIFWKAVPEGIQTIEDIAKLPGGSISVESGSIPEAYMENYPKIPTKSFQGTLSAMMDVKFGKSTANLVQSDVAEYLMRQHPEIKVLNVPLVPNTQVLGFGIGIKKNNQELIDQVRTAISELKSSGELAELENKWFKGEK